MKCNITNGTLAHIGENQDVYKEVRQGWENHNSSVLCQQIKKEDKIKKKTIILFILCL